MRVPGVEVDGAVVGAIGVEKEGAAHIDRKCVSACTSIDVRISLAPH